MKKITIISLLVIFTLLFASGCSSDKDATTESGSTVTLLSSEEAKQMMDEEQVTVVDVRTPDEYSEGHVPNAILVPLDKIQAKDFGDLPDKDAKLLVYCRSGNRSSTAAGILLEEGYTQVYDFGGINSWPYEIEK